MARRALAYHEAGHAVVACSLRVPVLDIKIEGLRGRVRYPLRLSQLHPETDFGRLQKLALILFGGEDAEQILDDQAECFASEDDNEQINAIAELLFETNVTASSSWIDGIKDRANVIVIENWDRVRALAAVLTKESFISGERATHIIGDAKTTPTK